MDRGLFDSLHAPGRVWQIRADNLALIIPTAESMHINRAGLNLVNFLYYLGLELFSGFQVPSGDDVSDRNLIVLYGTSNSEIYQKEKKRVRISTII